MCNSSVSFILYVILKTKHASINPWMKIKIHAIMPHVIYMDICAAQKGLTWDRSKHKCILVSERRTRLLLFFQFFPLSTKKQSGDLCECLSNYFHFQLFRLTTLDSNYFSWMFKIQNFNWEMIF